MQVVNLALNMGRMLQKTQTGFIHYCAQSEDGVTHDTTPILENALFALSLFRSRQADNVIEAKALLENLLAFEAEGTFPSYLHRYPHSDDPYLNLRLLPVFFWILTDFPHVLGTLKRALQDCFDRLMTHAKQNPLPPWGPLRLNAFEGKVEGAYDYWQETFISLQIAEKMGANIKSYIDEACALWHPALQLNVGPSKKRPTYKKAPVVTLFDLYMAQWQHQFSKRLLEPTPAHLYAALIRPLSFEPSFPSLPVPHVHFNKEEDVPLWVAWSDHHFVLCQPQGISIERNGEELLIFLNEAEDVSFFVDYHDDHKFFVNNQKATAFRLGDTFEIRSQELTLSLVFESDEGIYFGHLLRGNRLHQHGCKGKEKFAAYDWQISLRTVKKGSSPIRVRLQVGLPEQESLQPLPLRASHYQHIQ